MDASSLRTVNWILDVPFALLGLLGNGVVIAAVARFHFLQTSANFLVLGLAVSDLLICLTQPVYLGE